MAEDDLSHLTPEDRRNYLVQLGGFQHMAAQIRDRINVRGATADAFDFMELNAILDAIELLRDEYGVPRGTVH